MKLTLLVCLLGLAAAAEQVAAKAAKTAKTAKIAHTAHTAKTAADSGDGDAADAADTADNNDYDTEGAYTAEASYHFVRAVDTCYSGCDSHAPCFNRRTGQCAPKVCEAHVHYASYEPAQDEGYRRLQYDSYAAPVEYQHEEYRDNYHPPRPRCGCPRGFEDTRDFAVHNRVVLWVAFGLLFAPALCFLWRGLLRTIPDSLSKGKDAKKHAEQWEEVSLVQIGAGVVCLIASLAYLTMSLGHGYISKCDGRSFYYARYVDWMLTTPLMLWDLCKLSNADHRTTLFVIFIDFIMIASGLIGGLMSGTERWAFFGFSIACFLPIIYFLCWLDGEGTGNLCGILSNTVTDRRKNTYRRAMNLTVISWIGYPVIWAVAEGGQNLSANGEAIAYTVLDIISKSVFGWIIVFSEWGGYLEAVKDVVNTGSSML